VVALTLDCKNEIAARDEDIQKVIEKSGNQGAET